jgi:zinc protease
MQRTLIILFALFLFVGSAQSQPRLIESQKKHGNDIVIPYEKYVLPNGLTVILHEDHSDPIVHVDVTYHVGSAREQVGMTGFAHFFEHMMFQGSAHVDDDAHFKIITEAGGTLNGTTNRDRTNYFETVPSNYLETVLWLESDRMGFLLDSVTQQKFEIQRATVKNERAQRYDNRPYGLVDEHIYRALYPYGNPYSWMTIGYIEDLNRVNVDDLKKFFLRWYGPNNAVLTIGGDIDPKKTLRLVEKYFGTILRGPEVKDMAKMTVDLPSDRYISYQDKIRFPQIEIVFPSVPNFHKDEAALDCLADILGGGKNSFLYKNLVKTEKAVSASASNPCSELSGEFTISVKAFPGKSLTEMQKLVQQSLEEFEQRDVTDDDLKRFRQSFESNTINSLASVSGKVGRLASYETFTGNPNHISTDLARYTSLTKEDVMRVYREYIKNRHAVILSVVPEGKPDLIAAQDNYTPPNEGNTSGKDDYQGLTYKRAMDKFDRSKQPSPSSAPTVRVPDYWQHSFKNGLKLIGTEGPEIPTVTLQLSIDGGHLLEADSPSKAGLGYLTASLLNEATERYSSEEMQNALEKIGSRITVSPGNEQITVTIESLVKNLDATLELAKEKLFHPKFDSTDFARLKKLQMERIANEQNDPSIVCARVFNKVLYSEDNILALPAIGTTETVGQITLDDVKAFYKKMLSPNVSTLVVVGDISKNRLLPKLDFLKEWIPKSVAIPEPKPAPKIAETTLYFVNKDNAPQSEIRIGYVALPYDATGNFYRATVMNYVLGDAFNSRINMNLREDKGYTYGARSGFVGTKIPGPFVAKAGVKREATANSVIEFIKEMKTYRDQGITKKEMLFTKRSIGQQDACKYETPVQKAGFLRNIIQYNLPKAYVLHQNFILNTLTKTEIDRLAKEYLPIEHMCIVVVGDKAAVMPDLQRLDYPIIELTATGDHF